IKRAWPIPTRPTWPAPTAPATSPPSSPGNPLVSEIVAMPGAHKVFDSTQIPGEIIDLMVVNTATLKDNPALGKALVGAWYEAMALMTSGTPEGKAAKEEMAKASGTDLAGFDSQLASTAMFFE